MHSFQPGISYNKYSCGSNITVAFIFQIVTAESSPFVTAYKLPASGNCSHLNIVERGTKRGFVECTGPSAALPGTRHCCTGKQVP